MAKRTPIITLTTDFGTRDSYAAEMKGVILSILPGARIIDVTHELPPYDPWRAGFTLAAAAAAFPSDTVHVAVVDPGVGTARRPLALRAGGQWFVGPDNGLFSLLRIRDPHGAAWVLPVRPGASRTFHGRDVFAPAAARLAKQGAGSRLPWKRTRCPMVFDDVVPVRASERSWEGRVIGADRFGNVETTLPGGWWERGASLTLAGKRISNKVAAFQDLARHTLGVLVNSRNRLEIVGNQCSAEERLRARVRQHVKLELSGS